MLEEYVNVDKLDKLDWDKLDEDKLDELVSSNECQSTIKFIK